MPEPTVAAGLGDPARAAVFETASGFANPGRLAGRPAEAAALAAQLEWMAAELTQRPEWRSATPMLDPALRQARAELRAALGIAPDAPPAAVAAALRQAAPALRAGQAEAAAAALDPVAAGDGRRVLARLANLPPLPRAAFATGLALDELSRETRTDLE